MIANKRKQKETITICRPAEQFYRTSGLNLPFVSPLEGIYPAIIRGSLLTSSDSKMFDFNQVCVVLVNTSHPGNIGATARAMKNMGLSKLTLVAPADFPSGVAVGRAVSAVDILDNARVVSSLQEAVEGCGLVIGASARSRNIPWPMVSPEQCGQKAVTEAAVNKVALVFGREDAGLNNEELQLCHFHVQMIRKTQGSLCQECVACLVASESM